MSSAATALHSAASVDWYTPPEIIEAVRETLGEISLDPASCAKANEIVKADVYNVGEGLESGWFGPCFCNPPGKSPTNPGGQAAWWNKMVNEYFDAIEADMPWSGIFLGFSLELLQTAQRYDIFQPLDFAHCIPAKRIKFINAAGERMKSPTHSNIIVCLTQEQEVEYRFRVAFEKFGYVGGPA